MKTGQTKSAENSSEKNNSQHSMVHKKMNEAYNSSSEGLDKDTKPALEQFLGFNFGNIRVHNNAASHQASDLIHAKAYTTGNHIFLGNEVNAMSPRQRKSLLAHETVHTVQQKSFSAAGIQAKSIIDSPQSSYEQEANSIAHDFIQQPSASYQSAGLAMRRHNRMIGSVSSPVIQRDIKGSENLKYGKMELDFTKNDAAAAGAGASESGTAKFTPNDTAPNSNNIRLIQIVRVVDTSGISTTAGKPWDYAGGAEGDRDNVRTNADSKKNIAGGFFIDHSAATANPRTKKSDAAVSPFYRDYWPNATESQDGYKKSKTDIQHASLWDSPGHSAPVKYNFVTSAKAAGGGFWYGSALWGFEIYLDKGIAKIKNEYKSFRNFPGETTVAALKEFNEFYKNPGTSGAPTK